MIFVLDLAAAARVDKACAIDLETKIIVLFTLIKTEFRTISSQF